MVDLGDHRAQAERLKAARGLPPETAAELQHVARPPAEMRKALFDALARAADRRGTSRYSMLVPFFAQLGGAVVLVPPLGGTTSLVFGAGWGALSRVVAAWGGCAIGLDSIAEFARYAAFSRGSARELYVRGGELLRLPFAANAFDHVFALGALEWIAETTEADQDPGTVQRRLLAEFWRVLKPSGRLLLSVRNRWGIDTLGGRRDPFSGLRGIGLLPRPLADQWSRTVRGRPYRAYTHSRRSYELLLRSEGFSAPTCFVPWPDSASWSRLVAAAGRPAGNDVGHFGSSRKAKLVNGAVRSLRVFGLHERLAPEYLLLARKVAGNAPSQTAERAPSIVDLVLRQENIAPPDPLVIRSYPHSSMLAVLADGRFVKFPLTEVARKRLWREKAAVDALGSHPASRHTLTPQVREYRGVVYGVYPAFEIDTKRRTGEAEDKLGRVTRALDLLATSKVDREVGDTEFWRRISSPDVRSGLELWAVGPLLRRLETRVMGKKVPAGVLHGDVHATNAFYDTAGEFRLIDWDRSQACSPLVLDPTHAAHLYATQWCAGGSSYDDKLAHALQMCLAHAQGVPLLDRVQSLLGELTWGEAWALHVVRWIADQLSADEEMLTYYRCDAMQRPIELCTEWLESE
jgi:SAM-dependent methyltransferase